MKGFRIQWVNKNIFLLLSNGKEIEVEEFYMRDQKVFDALEIKE